MLTKEKVESKSEYKKTLTGVSTNPIKDVKHPHRKIAVQNPIDTEKSNAEIISAINKFNAFSSQNRLYGARVTSPITVNKIINGNEIARAICSALQNKKEITELFAAVTNAMCEKLNCVYVGFGLYHETSKCIDFKLFSQNSGSFSSKITQSDTDNPIMQAYLTQKIIFCKDNSFYNIPYITSMETLVLPLMSIDKCLGVMVLNRNNLEENKETIVVYLS